MLIHEQRCGGLDTLLMVRQAWWIKDCLLMAPTAYSYGGPVDVAYYRAFYFRPVRAALTISTVGVYGGIVGFIAFTYCYCSGLIAIASVRASRIVHNRLVDSILASTFR
jgi:hypothetical protein